MYRMLVFRIVPSGERFRLNVTPTMGGNPWDVGITFPTVSAASRAASTMAECAGVPDGEVHIFEPTVIR